MKVLAIIVMVMVLVGCQSIRSSVRALVYVPKHVPVYIERPVVKPGTIDPAWLKPCPTDKANEETYEEARRLAESRLQIIVKCDHADKAKIKNAIENSQ